MRWSVDISREVEQFATIDVEAETAEGAREAVYSYLSSIDWHDHGTISLDIEGVTPERGPDEDEEEGDSCPVT